MIHFENVVKAYARTTRPALDRVTLDIPQGRFVYLVGASGSGKSTVIRLLLCEEAVTSGRIDVAGRDLSRLRRHEIPGLRRDLGVVFQDFRLLPDKTVYDNVAYVMHVLGASSKDVGVAVPQTLELVGLTSLSRRFPHELSGGEQQRVAIARAVVKKPRLLLADEPTGNLDPGTSMEIVKLLARIHEAGTTVLMATHDDSIVNTLRRRVIELEAGRIVRDEVDGAYFAPRPVTDDDADTPADNEPDKPARTKREKPARAKRDKPADTKPDDQAKVAKDAGAAEQQATVARRLMSRRANSPATAALAASDDSAGPSMPTATGKAER